MLEKPLETNIWSSQATLIAPTCVTEPHQVAPLNRWFGSFQNKTRQKNSMAGQWLNHLILHIFTPGCWYFNTRLLIFVCIISRYPIFTLQRRGLIGHRSTGPWDAEFREDGLKERVPFPFKIREFGFQMFWGPNVPKTLAEKNKYQ